MSKNRNPFTNRPGGDAGGVVVTETEGKAVVETPSVPTLTVVDDVVITPAAQPAVAPAGDASSADKLPKPTK